MAPASQITRIEHRIAAAERTARNRHAGGVLWFTGLSGAGKSTLAFALEERLFQDGYQVFVLDGDNLRHGLNADLGFSHTDRTENIRRAGEVAALFAAAGLICIAAFISPYRQGRAAARAAAGDAFREIYIRADLATCEARDPKGLYRRARRGQLADFTAIDDVYEAPEAAELVIDTTEQTVGESLAALAGYAHSAFPRPGPLPRPGR